MYFGEPKTVPPTVRDPAGKCAMPKSMIFTDPAVQHHDVGRLDVAVNDVVLVRECKPVGDLCDDVGGFFDRDHDARVEDVAQRPALQVLHGNIGDPAALADIVDRDDA